MGTDRSRFGKPLRDPWPARAGSSALSVSKSVAARFSEALEFRERVAAARLRDELPDSEGARLVCFAPARDFDVELRVQVAVSDRAKERLSVFCVPVGAARAPAPVLDYAKRPW